MAKNSEDEIETALSAYREAIKAHHMWEEEPDPHTMKEAAEKRMRSAENEIRKYLSRPPRDKMVRSGKTSTKKR